MTIYFRYNTTNNLGNNMKCLFITLIFAFNLSCIYAKNINIDNKISQIKLNINSIFGNKQIPTHKQKQVKLQCNLTNEERNLVNLQYPDTFYEYYNAILEINYAKDKMSKLTQDLLIESIRRNNTLSLLLGIQLYFSKQCERCERVREISMFDYYRNKNSTMEILLKTEGGSFKNSYVLLGEAFLCRGLERKNSNDLLMAYVNLMMAGLHTRAINVLIEGIAVSNNNMLFETLHFLMLFDNVLSKDFASAYFLSILKAEQKQSNFDIIQYLKIIKNLKVLEYSIESNYTLNAMLIRDMEMGRILSPIDKFANKDTIIEFFNKYEHYVQLINKGNVSIIENGSLDELQEYYKILLLKQRLKSISIYQYATAYKK